MPPMSSVSYLPPSILLLLAGVPLRPGAVRGHEGLPWSGREAEALQTRPQHEEDEHDGREVMGTLTDAITKYY